MPYERSLRMCATCELVFAQLSVTLESLLVQPAHASIQVVVSAVVKVVQSMPGTVPGGMMGRMATLE